MFSSVSFAPTSWMLLVDVAIVAFVGYAVLRLGHLVLNGPFMYRAASKAELAAVMPLLQKRIQYAAPIWPFKLRSTSATLRLPVAIKTLSKPPAMTQSLPQDTPLIVPTAGPKAGLRVLFFGTDAISLATLQLLHANMQPTVDDPQPLIQSIEVVCPTDKRVARTRSIAPVPVKKFALEHQLRVHHVPDSAQSRRSWTPAPSSTFDIAVVVSFGYFIHPPMLAHVAKGAINMHPSILPKYRGPAPIPRALFRGDKATGISIIEIDPKAFDVGRVLYCDDSIVIPDSATLPELTKTLATRGAECVIDTLRDVDNLLQHARPQDGAKASVASKMRREDGLVTWTETAAQLHNMWRAVGSTYGVVATLGGKSIKFIELHRPSLDAVAGFETRFAMSSTKEGEVAPGALVYDKATKSLWIRAADGEWIVVSRVQVANRTVRTASEFADGQRLRSLQPAQFDAPTNFV